MKKKKYLIIMFGIVIYIFILIGQDRVPIEELNMISGIGYDINKKGKDMMEYIVPLSINIYHSSGTQDNIVVEERAENIGDTIQKRQNKLTKKFVQGQERVIIIGERYALNGINTFMEDRFKNTEVTDMAFAVICKGNPEEYFKQKITGYNSAAEFMDGLVENSKDYGFFSDNYKLIDMYVRIGAEGKSLLLPYIELTNEGIEITGSAVFNNDKMVQKLDLQNTKMLNFLKESNVKGMFSLVKDSKKYIDFDGKTGERKVQCTKVGDKYNFNIEINLVGNIINNELYKNILNDINEKKQFEKDMAKSIEKDCYAFLSLMQNQYKMDFIDLGKEAAGKYGRKKGIDWNKEVSKADIKVKIKVKVDRQGRGDY